MPVHLNGAAGLYLEMQPLDVDRSAPDVDDDEWSKVCDAPCDRPLPSAGVYRVTGPGTSPSDDFRLHVVREDRPLVLDVRAASNARRGTGIGLIIGGSLIIGVGAIFTAAGATVSSEEIDKGGAIGAGLATMGVGGALVALGIVLRSGTSVKQEQWPDEPPAAAPPPNAAAASVSMSPLRLPTPSSTPLFTARF